VQLRSKNVAFQPTDDGKDSANLIVAAASLDKDRRFLASRIHTLTLLTQDMRPLPDVASSFRLTIPVPRKTSSVRVVIQNEDGGQIGTADLDRKTIDAAPVTQTPEPQLSPRGERPIAPKTELTPRFGFPAFACFSSGSIWFRSRFETCSTLCTASLNIFIAGVFGLVPLMLVILSLRELSCG
jgi:hypothetical protein